MGFLTQALSACFVGFNFFSHTNLGDPTIEVDYADCTVSRNHFFSIQRGLNRKGIGLIFSSSSRIKRMCL